MKCILFVCSGNTCRSPIAQGLAMKYATEHNLDICVISAGIFAEEDSAVSENALKVLDEHGIDMSYHKPRKVTLIDVEKADIIGCMSDQHAYALVQLFPNHAHKIRVLGKKGIGDPFGGNIDMYRHCFNDIEKAIPRVIIELYGDVYNG